MTLMLMAIAPALLIVIYIYIKDKYEKEPKKLLLTSFLLGAVFSVIVTTILYSVFKVFLPLPDDFSIVQLFIKAFFVVGLIEEFSKYLVVRYYAQPKADFNEPFDGIVYAVMVSMGFAMLENIAYVMQSGMSTAILRAFTAVPAHATFAILMGYFMGKAKFSPNKKILNLVGLTLAILFHGAYDFFLFIHFVPGISIGAFISLGIGVVLSRNAIKKHQLNSTFK
ncbi:PrsW family glutamic-type intramembrane protease [Flavobacteriaceae bacterium F08102]|nr:PrsW family glutamic-type intramembrane protease [Flavobacteriaceae bacterium F08102]